MEYRIDLLEELWKKPGSAWQDKPLGGDEGIGTGSSKGGFQERVVFVKENILFKDQKWERSCVFGK